MILIPQAVERTQQHGSLCFLRAITNTISPMFYRLCRSVVAGTFAIVLVILIGPEFGSPAFAQDPLGSASLSKHNGTGACPPGGLTGGTCWDVKIWDCPETGDTMSNPFWASVKVNVPPNKAAPVGFVFFTTGGGGDAYYDNFSQWINSTETSCPAQGNPVKYNCGKLAVQTVNNANFTTVQTNFSDPNNVVLEPVGWLTGPAGGSTDGPRAMACRYATLVNAVWNSTIINKATQKPICATGNSAGSSAAAYALTQYGMSIATPTTPLLSMVEASSGPPMGRIDHGCSHTPQCYPVSCGPTASNCQPGMLKEGYGVGTALKFIDPSYDGDQETSLDSADICAESIKNNVGNDTLFHHDSVWSDDYSTPNFPHTYVNFVFGALDGSSAVPLGTEWYNAIKSSKPMTPVCVSGAPHELPGTFLGASQVASDLSTMCKLY